VTVSLTISIKGDGHLNTLMLKNINIKLEKVKWFDVSEVKAEVLHTSCIFFKNFLQILVESFSSLFSVYSTERGRGGR